MSTTLIPLNEREHATILAALRYFQAVTEVNGIPPSVAGHFVDNRALSPTEIDGLCQEITTPITPYWVNVGLSTYEVLNTELFSSYEEGHAHIAHLDDVSTIPVYLDQGDADDGYEEPDGDAP